MRVRRWGRIMESGGCRDIYTSSPTEVTVVDCLSLLPLPLRRCPPDSSSSFSRSMNQVFLSSRRSRPMGIGSLNELQPPPPPIHRDVFTCPAFPLPSPVVSKGRPMVPHPGGEDNPLMALRFSRFSPFWGHLHKNG